jgi:hypothetical protein
VAWMISSRGITALVSDRFMQPDPVGGHLTDPQTLNLYAYVTQQSSRSNPSDRPRLSLSCQHTENNGSTCQQMQVGKNKDGKAQMAWVLSPGWFHWRRSCCRWLRPNEDPSGGWL